MNTQTLNRTLVAMLAAAGIGIAGAANAAIGTISSDKYSSEKARIKAVYDADMTGCKPMSGNVKDICEVTVKGRRDVALAENEAAYKNTVKARYDARLAHTTAAYKLAKEKCDDLTGNPKDVCVKEAKAVEVKARADAKVDRVAMDTSQTAAKKVTEAKQDAREDKRDADYKVAAEKCDSLSGATKDLCVADAKKRFGKT